MAIQRPIRVTDTIRLISPTDDSIDLEATRPEVLTQYLDPQDDSLPDPSTLILREGSQPTWFEIGPLNEHQRAIVEGAGTTSVADALYAAARFGLRSCSDTDWWVPRFGIHCGYRALTQESLVEIDNITVRWLGSVALKLSTLPEAKKKLSASKHAKPSGRMTSVDAE